MASNHDTKCVRVRFPGTLLTLDREAEPEGKCDDCKRSKRTRFSYDDTGECFCNIRCWMRRQALKHYLGGQRLRNEHGNRTRRRLAVVLDAS